MTRPAVFLTLEQRSAAVSQFVRSMSKQSIEMVVLAIDRIHFHLLARFPDHNPRKYVGIAKKESSHYLKERCNAPVGGLWGTRTQCVPIKSRSHQVSVVRYIVGHRKKGAAFWTSIVSALGGA